MEKSETQNIQNHLERNKVGRLICQSQNPPQSYSVQTMWSWHNDRHTDQENKTESLERKPKYL